MFVSATGTNASTSTRCRIYLQTGRDAIFFTRFSLQPPEAPMPKTPSLRSPLATKASMERSLLTEPNVSIASPPSTCAKWFEVLRIRFVLNLQQYWQGNIICEGPSSKLYRMFLRTKSMFRRGYSPGLRRGTCRDGRTARYDRRPANRRGIRCESTSIET